MQPANHNMDYYAYGLTKYATSGGMGSPTVDYGAVGTAMNFGHAVHASLGSIGSTTPAYGIIQGFNGSTIPSQGIPHRSSSLDSSSVAMSSGTVPYVGYGWLSGSKGPSTRPVAQQSPPIPEPPTEPRRRRIEREIITLTRVERGLQEIVVTADGAHRNTKQIVQRFLPCGLPYDTVNKIFDPAIYNFMEDFKSMRETDQKTLFEKNGVELTIIMPEGWDSNENQDIKEVNGKGAITTIQRTVLDALDELGSEFTSNIKRCTVSLVFPSNPDQTALNTSIALAPTSGAPVESPTYLFLEELCHYIDAEFTSLKSLTVLLRVPSNVRMPLSLQQLYHVLPFYDLSLTDWQLKYTPDNLDREQLRVKGWCIKQLDRERDRVVVKRTKKEERERRRIEEAVFVHASANQGDVDLKKLRIGEIAK